jgi:hypothetical protein
MKLLTYIWAAIKTLSRSKKAQIAFISALVWILGRFGLDLSAEDIMPLVGSCWAYIFGQGLADIGKERVIAANAAMPAAIAANKEGT